MGPKGTLYFCLRRYKSRHNGACAWGTWEFQRILTTDKLKDVRWGEVQGEKEMSLTGFLSCTTDSMETGRREWKTRVGNSMWGKGWKGKGRQLMHFV